MFSGSGEESQESDDLWTLVEIIKIKASREWGYRLLSDKKSHDMIVVILLATTTLAYI